GEPETVVQGLVALAAILEEPKERVDRLRGAARILETRENGRPRAIELYEKVIEIAPADLETIGRLDAMYTATGRFNDLDRLLISVVERLPAGPERATLLLRIGRLKAAKLDDFFGAVEVLGQIVSSSGEGSNAALDGAVDTLSKIMEAKKVSEPTTAARAAE